MPFAIPLVLTVLLAQAAPILPTDARVTRDAATGHVRQLSSVEIPLAAPDLKGLITGFFAPLRAELGFDPAELVEESRTSWSGGTSVELRRVIDGREVVDGTVRVTLGTDGSVRAYVAGDVAPVTRTASPVLDEARARVAAREVLGGLSGEGRGDLVYLGGKLAWRLRFPPAPSQTPGRSPHLYAPVVFVDAVSGEVLALRNGLVR